MKSKQESEILIEELSQELITVAETFCKMNSLKDIRDHANIATQSFVNCLCAMTLTNVICIKKLTTSEKIKLGSEINRHLCDYITEIMGRGSK